MPITDSITYMAIDQHSKAQGFQPLQSMLANWSREFGIFTAVMLEPGLRPCSRIGTVSETLDSRWLVALRCRQTLIERPLLRSSVSAMCTASWRAVR